MNIFRTLLLIIVITGLGITSCDLAEAEGELLNNKISATVTENQKEKEDEKDKEEDNRNNEDEDEDEDESSGGTNDSPDNENNGNSQDGEDSEEPGREPIPGEFVILFTNDFHSQIEPLSKEEKYNADRGGIKRIKALVDSVRAAEPVVLLADAGDLVQGTFYFSLLNGVVEMMILEELGYDVRTLGNHEFDKKMTGLGEMLAMSKVPVVSTNYDCSNTNISRYVTSSTMIQAGTVKVGFVGLNIKLEGLVDPTSCEGVIWQDNAYSLADHEAANLRSQGADIVIALSHLGYSQTSNAYYYDRGVAQRTRNIDMIIGGHSHTFINQADYVNNLDRDPVPIVQTGSKGICLGYAKVKIGNDGKPSFTYRLIPVKNHLDSKLDPVFSAKIDSYAAEIDEMNDVIGYCPYAMSKGNPESPLSNLTADGLIWAAKEFHNVDADISIYNSGGIRTSISEGNLTVSDVYALYPFDNILSVVTMKGKDLKDFFEIVARYGGMPINAGVRLVIRNNAVKSVTVNGKEIEDDKEYRIATIDYLVNTEDYFNAKIAREDFNICVREYFVEYFRYLAALNGGYITAAKDGRIKIE